MTKEKQPEPYEPTKAEAEAAVEDWYSKNSMLIAEFAPQINDTQLRNDIIAGLKRRHSTTQ
ncbi:MAG: hypothetical protein AAB573_01310 [Patescibacteria group bacterium]